jgi:hypothetical protein
MSSIPLQRLGLLFAVLELTLATAGCTGDAPCPPDCGSVTEADTEGGLYHLALEPNPDPPVTGDASLRIAVIARSDQAPIEDARITVEPWMVAHEHGLSDPAAVEALGGGVYRAHWAYSMSGYWTVTITIDSSRGIDDAVVGYQVQ